MFTGIAAGAIGFAVIAWLLTSRVGFVAGLVFVVFTATSSQLTYWVGSGLETPLSILLLALALYSVLGTDRLWVLGLAAGLLMIHKLDMIPVGGLVLLAGFVRDKRFPVKAVAVAFSLAAVWYLFAWWYFGAPVPNSFITKALHQRNIVPIIDWRWFGQFVLMSGIGKFMSMFLIGLWFADRSLRPTLLVFGGLLLTHLAAYTIKHPVEPYGWYGMGALTSLALLASLGMHSFLLAVFRSVAPSRRTVYSIAASLGIMAVVVLLAYHKEKEFSLGFQAWGAYYEKDRADAGRWVEKNTPADFVVMAGHGNPAYFSKRNVIDSSYLNRRFERANALEKYRPEIFISNGLPGDPEFKAPLFKEYKAVKVFDSTLSAGIDPKYWFVVLARKDVVSRLGDVGAALPISLESYIKNVKLGDQYGVLQREGRNVIFVHPGVTSPTVFDFDAEGYVAASGGSSVQIDVEISPKVPADAVARGAAVIRVSFLNKQVQRAQAEVKPGHPFHFSMPVEKGDAWTVVVDNLNGPDTDWALVSFK